MQAQTHTKQTDLLMPSIRKAEPTRSWMLERFKEMHIVSLFVISWLFFFFVALLYPSYWPYSNPTDPARTFRTILIRLKRKRNE